MSKKKGITRSEMLKETGYPTSGATMPGSGISGPGGLRAATPITEKHEWKSTTVVPRVAIVKCAPPAGNAAFIAGKFTRLDDDIAKIKAAVKKAVEQPRPTGEVCVVNPPPFSVGAAPPAVMSCAEMLPQDQVSPSTAPTIVPVTVVKPPCAAAGNAAIKQNNSPKILRIIVHCLWCKEAMNFHDRCARYRAGLRYAHRTLQWRDQRRPHPQHVG